MKFELDERVPNPTTRPRKDSNMKFELDERVRIAVSLEEGTVIGRAEYANGNENQYWVRYCDAQAMARECWWAESALVAI